MKRVFILVLDSFGIGYAPDAERFGDKGANTLGHIAKWYMQHQNNIGDTIAPLSLPHLCELGLSRAAQGASGCLPAGMAEQRSVIGSYGYAAEMSSGKDTPSGHWEIAGVPVLFDWYYFTEQKKSFPDSLLNTILKKGNLSGFLGNCHASGTQILDDLGEEHMKTGLPIFYTSGDSVFQVAVHEEIFGLDRLYSLCKTIRFLLDEQGYNIGRVIARPFVGNKKGDFIRTGNRRDYAVAPPEPTVLQKLVEEKQGTVISIGKISDIYAHTGITHKIKATGIDALFDTTLKQADIARDNCIVFTNFVNFDSDYGHRRDVQGYGKALELFDRRLPELLAQLHGDDLLIITADHGCDPTWCGTDHTREYIPVLIYGPDFPALDLGRRETFADIGQTIAEYFGLSAMGYGQSMLTFKQKVS